MDVGVRVWVQDPAQDSVWVSARIVRTILQPDSNSAADSSTNKILRAVSVRVDDPAENQQQQQDASSSNTSGPSESAWSDQLSSTSAPSPSKCREIVLLYKPSGECENVLLQNQREEQDQADLVTLPHLHEASILHSLRIRYERDAIYTRIGEILISINPFKKLPQLYGRVIMEDHAHEGMSLRTAEPHLFGIAKAAYLDMARNARNQSILISGESGAGKTEATKIMMKYYALTCSASAHADKTGASSNSNNNSSSSSTTSIESQVLQSNPILEAFGNARTTRNDNSSRFGKFIELQFETTNDAHIIAGARIRTYLLEKIRVIKQSLNERNFHVFYELLGAAAAFTEQTQKGTPASSKYLSSEAVASWQLLDVTQFRLVNQSDCYTRRDNVVDATQFEKTCRAMHLIGMSEGEVANVLEIVAAMLHMGNVDFTESHSEGDNVLEAHIVQENPISGVRHFDIAAQLLRVSPKQLENALTTRQLHTATESLVVRMDAAQAENTRNALLMECYRLLFEWLVGRINSKIRRNTANARENKKSEFIGLLDIFGFEDMATNSFEQLCINYANEALQHQFNEFVFEEEQKLYKDEGIGWTFVDFPNNLACLELFEKKPIGIFSLTDQECLFPQGTDRALVAKYYGEFEKKMAHPHFLSTAGFLRQTHFIVAHYAGRVTYTAEGFLAKNKDSFCESAAQLLSNSSSPLIQSLAAVGRGGAEDQTSAPAADHHPSDGSAAGVGRVVNARRAKSTIGAISVGTQFKMQLNELMEIIRSTTPHYVRCIKPNDTNIANNFQCTRVVEQLRSGGVLEAVRVARAGFPVRMSHQQFLERYQRVLLSEYSSKNRLQVLSKRPVAMRLDDCLKRITTLIHGKESTLKSPDGVSLGKTRVFFRRQPYEKLESYRSQALKQSVIVIQKYCRMYQQRKRYQCTRELALRLQAHFRGQRSRDYVIWVRQTIKATVLQAQVRKFCARSKFLRFKHAVLTLQCHFQRRQASRRVQVLREARAATRISTAWRCFSATTKYNRIRSAILALQCAERMRVAKKQLTELRLESKNVAKLKEDNIHLKSELAQLKQQLEAMKSIIKPTQQQLEPQDFVHVDHQESNQSYNDAHMMMMMHDNGNPNSADGFVGLRPRRVSFPICVDLVSSSQKPTLSSPGSQRTTTGFSRGVRQRRTSLPDISCTFEPTSDDFDALSPRTVGRRQSLDLWRAQQVQAEEEVRQLRDELRASALSSTQPDDEKEQERVMRKIIASQIKAKTMRLQLSPSSSPPSFEMSIPEDEDDNNYEMNEAHSPWYDDDSSDDEYPRTGRVGRGRSQTVEDASFTRGGRQLYAAPKTSSGAYGRYTWSSKTLSTKHGRGLSAAYFDEAMDDDDDDADSLYLPSRSISLGVRPRASSVASTWRSTFSVTPGAAALPRWSKDTICKECHCKFSLLTRRHHCRNCGHSFCFEHSTRKLLLPGLGYTERQRVCDECFEYHMLNEEQHGGMLLSLSPQRHHVSFGSEQGNFAPIAPMPKPGLARQSSDPTHTIKA